MLYCKGGVPLSSTADALVVSDDDEVKVGEKRLEVHDEMRLIRNEEAVCCLHVCYVCVEGVEKLVAEETFLVVEDGFLFRCFGWVLLSCRTAGAAGGSCVVYHCAVGPCG